MEDILRVPLGRQMGLYIGEAFDIARYGDSVYASSPVRNGENSRSRRLRLHRIQATEHFTEYLVW